MGSCFGRCLPNSEKSYKITKFNLLKNHDTSVEFSFIENTTQNHCESVKTNYFTRIFSKRIDDKKPKKPVLELVDEILNPHVSSYSRLTETQRFPSSGSCTSRDIPLQCLDARALLSRTVTSTPASSLDLEWEHETLPASMIHDPSGSSWTALPEDVPIPSISESSPVPAQGSDSDWSRVSSANSLEWDNVQNSLQISPPASDIDADTQLLLCEIERLTTQTLSETGLDLFS